MTYHTVRQGECLSSIGRDYGVPWRKIWEDSNNEGLRSRRRDPNVLYPGDRLYIPERGLREEACATEQRHRFRLKGVPGKFRLRLMYNGRPRANEPYTLEIEDLTFEGETDGDGWLEHRIPPGAYHGQLLLNEGREVYRVNLGHLDPADTDEGVQQRLYNLGYYAGAIDGIVGPKTRAALQMFQAAAELEVTGEIDEPTRDALVDAHGS